MMTPKLLICEGQIAISSIYKERQLVLDKTDLEPTSKASVLLPFTFKLISAKQLDKDGGGKEPVGLANR